MIHSFINAGLQGKNGFGRYLAGIFIIFLFSMVIGGIPALIVFEMSDNPSAAAEMDFKTAGINETLGFSLFLFPLGCADFSYKLFFRCLNRCRQKLR